MAANGMVTRTPAKMIDKTVGLTLEEFEKGSGIKVTELTDEIDDGEEPKNEDKTTRRLDRCRSMAQQCNPFKFPSKGQYNLRNKLKIFISFFQLVSG